MQLNECVVLASRLIALELVASHPTCCSSLGILVGSLVLTVLDNAYPMPSALLSRLLAYDGGEDLKLTASPDQTLLNVGAIVIDGCNSSGGAVSALPQKSSRPAVHD